ALGAGLLTPPSPDRKVSETAKGGRRPGEGGVMKTCVWMGLGFIRFPLMKASSVRRGSPGTRRVAVEVPDRRSPALIVGPGFKGIRALRAHSEGRRPSVGHAGGVRRPAPNKHF